MLFHLWKNGSPTPAPPPPQSLPPTPPLPRAVPPTSQPPLPLPPTLSPVARGARTALAVSLPNYKRASNTSSYCIFNSCINGTIIPAFVKRILVQEHNFYVPRSCRVGQIHLFSNEWHSLPQSAGLISTFNVRQIGRPQYNELMLFSLGPYQVKQARDYYGEYIRENGI